MSVIPLILAGHFEDVGKTFQEAIQPDFDVVYFVTSPQAGLADIPAVLKGEIPTSAAAAGSRHKVGSGNLAHGTPRAVVVSGSYDDAFVERLRQEIAAVGKAVPILKLDRSGAPAGAAGAKPAAEKTKAVAERAVKVLKKLEDEGKLDGDDDGVYSY
ncbi:Aspartate aminotransferase, cytoplasmic [Hypoxylon texense]